MGFLDNSGDIILDAVLTDEGRKALAKGDGSFKIVKFALADDEVDYSLYDKDHVSGSAYYDLQILQTPVLEAMTNAGAGLKHHLVSRTRKDKLYLPVARLNTKADSNAMADTVNLFQVAVTKTSRDKFSTVKGIMDGHNPLDGSTVVKISQGLDTTEVDPTVSLDQEDMETQWMIYMDNRLGSIVDKQGKAVAKSFVDSDNVATYALTKNANPSLVKFNSNTEQATATEIIAGPRGTDLEFLVRSSVELERSNNLFNQIGDTGTQNDKDGTSTAIRFIDSTIKVVGVTTGATIDVPIRFIKTSAE